MSGSQEATGGDFRPLARQLSRLENQLRVGGSGIDMWSIDPVMRDLFTMHETHGPVRERGPLHARLRLFLADIASRQAEPAAPELAAAPLIDRWSIIRQAGCAVLIGQTTSHPLLREGARTITSPLLRLVPAQGWARTWSRYYRLGRQDRTFVDQVIADGRLRRSTPVIELPPNEAK